MTGGSAFASPVFTTVSYDGEKLLFLGIKNKNESGSWIVEFDHASDTHKSVKLPESLVDRDVIGIIPEGNTLFVLTNWSAPDSKEIEKCGASSATVAFGRK